MKENSENEDVDDDDNGVDHFDLWTEGILLLAVGAVGLVGNGFSIIVFARQCVQRVFHHLLLLLALFDTVYIVCSILLFSLPLFIDGYEDVKKHLLPLLLPVIHVALVGSIYSTLALTVERYISICHPFLRYRSCYRSRVFILSIVLFSFLYTLPKFFELRIARIPADNNNSNNNNNNNTFIDEEEQEDEVVLQPTWLRKNKVYVRVYLIWLNLFVQLLVPFALLVGLNYRIYVTIKDSERNLRSILVGGRSHSLCAAAAAAAAAAEGAAENPTPIRTTLAVTNSSTDDTAKLTDSRSPSSSIRMMHRQCSRTSTAPPSSPLAAAAALLQQQPEKPLERSSSSSFRRNKATALRRREVVLSRISIYIVFVFLFCHSVRVVPNIYELVTTYTKEEGQSLRFPDWVLRFISVSHLLVTFATSANFFIYYAKYGSFCGLRQRRKDSGGGGGGGGATGGGSQRYGGRRGGSGNGRGRRNGNNTTTVVTGQSEPFGRGGKRGKRTTTTTVVVAAEEATATTVRLPSWELDENEEENVV